MHLYAFVYLPWKKNVIYIHGQTALARGAGAAERSQLQLLPLLPVANPKVWPSMGFGARLCLSTGLGIWV